MPAAAAGPPPIAPSPALEQAPPAASINPYELPPTHPEWRMSPPEPYVPRGRRRLWLWIVLGIIGACLVVCIALVVFVNTPLGRSFVNSLATPTALRATPTP